MTGAKRHIRKRLSQLEKHLQRENPLLVEAVDSFRKLDRVAYSLGLLDRNESFAMHISWWPLISVLGTFSAGKSTFINHYIGSGLQSTGNQAVDDKFSVICHSPDAEPHVLPGIALDADPRFPFYQFSDELDKVAEGEGRRVETYLQLKTTNSESLKGKIIIDSPGFDADAQRTATLRITSHIIDLSDLVLIMFDARHPEPGAMQDTLRHLVDETIERADSSKFLYILNQIDMSAREDNPEQIVAAWQRAIAQHGLTAGKFYTIYSPDAAITIEDDTLRQRYEQKRDADLNEIHSRINQVGVERVYRIMAALDERARRIEEDIIPELLEYKKKWANHTAAYNLFFIILFIAAGIGGGLLAGYWLNGVASFPFSDITSSMKNILVMAIGGVFAITGIHYLSRHLAAKGIIRKLKKTLPANPESERFIRAFRHNTRFLSSVFTPGPRGWNRFTRRRLQQVRSEADKYVQTLNNKFTDPSGESET